VPVVLFDLPAKEGPKNGIADRAIENLKKLSPAPLGIKEDAGLIRAANYEDDIALLKECDVVIEAIAERMDWKHDLYKKVAASRAERDLRDEHVGPVDHGAVRGLRCRSEVALLRCTSSTRRATCTWWS
jgi:hypothetical protein